ncbi:hypothetical protein IVA95_34225 [Bradyrhizobium sp. 157]|uniref:hypothetical protein n=1 Tax=Bradyrhizobium sp. 157 TaxID=2782631 RepID=UPI001FF75496|nr:hypothetical protein [Bradyrhizobium sp. 157]MCK1642481.1 hypothetical protein [Bradyrhizobium sp. 157]
MPTEATGGPWPEGWIEVLELWMDNNFPQLLLTLGQYTVQQIAGGGIVLAVSIPLDNGAAEAWLERELSSREQVEYTVWMRPPSQGLSRPAKVALHKEILSGPIDKLFINDAAGLHEIALPS